MKRKLIASIAFVMVLGITATGCEKTPDKALVSQKNNDRLEEAAKADPEEGASLKEVASATSSTYSFNYESEDGKLQIVADNAPVTLPVKDTIPMYHVNCGEISQEIADKVYDYFFPDGAYVVTGTDFTKDKYDEKILEAKQAIANAKDDPELSEEERTNIISINEEYLTNYEELKKSAPDKSTLKLEPRDSTYGEELYSTMDGDRTVKELSCVSRDQKRDLVIDSENAQSPLESTLYYSAMYEWNYFPDKGMPVEQCSEAEKGKIGISQEDATAKVNDFVEAIGMNWEIHDVFCVKGYKNAEGKSSDGEVIASDDYTAYQFILAQTIDGIQSAITSSNVVPEDDAAVTWLYEQIEIVVEPAGIVRVEWRYPLMVEDTVSDNVGIISFDQAKDIFENMMPLTAKGDLESWNDDRLEVSAKATVSDVRLGLMRVRNSGNDRTGLMTPVWIFYGDYNRSFHYLEGNEMLQYGDQDHSDSEPHPWILLAINAVDGSVIDIVEGY